MLHSLNSELYINKRGSTKPVTVEFVERTVCYVKLTMFLVKYLCLSTILFHEIASEIQTHVGYANVFQPHKHKYLVKLDITFRNPQPDYHNMYLCSGSIIDKKWIISAAHCFTDDVIKIQITKNIGSINRVIGFGRKFVNHPDFINVDPNCDEIYDYNNYKNDIALVKTAKPIQFNALTQPIGLARLRTFGQLGTIVGYGGDRYPIIPLEGLVVVDRCESGSKMLCSYYFAYAEHGDSGGALTTDDGLVGITSGGNDAVTQSIFVEISLHFKWILKVTEMNFTLHGPEITT